MQRSIEQSDQGIRLLQAVAIMLVVLGHIATPFGAIIFSFHMPLFFFLGGLFINPERDVLYFIKTNAKRLLVPYVIFGFLGFLVTALKNVLLHRPPVDLIESMSGLLYWMDTPHLQHYGFALWFLPALFIGRLLVFMLVKYIKNPLVIMLISIGLFAGTSLLPATLPFGFDKGMLGSVWIAAGFVFYRYCNVTAWWWSLLAGAMVVASVWLAGVQRLDIATMQVGLPWVTLVYTCSLAVILLQVTRAITNRFPLSQSGMLSLVGANTMLLFIAHPYTNNAANLIVKPVAEHLWYAEFVISFALLLILLKLKTIYSNSLAFKYV